MNPEQMGLMGGQPGPMPQQQGMPGQPGPEAMPGQPGPEAGMPPGQPGPEGMPPGGPPQEGMPPQQPSQPVPELSEEEAQALYERAYDEMSMLLDEKGTFDATRKMLSEAGDMLPEQFGMMMIGVVGKLEQDSGPLPFEVLATLAEALTEEAEDRWGVEMDEDEQTRADAAFFALYFQAHPDRVPWSQEEVEAMLGGQGGEEVPEEAPEEEMY